MKDRIKKYMDHKGINAGELALALEVQRSNISHILNGRNKPGAAFIEKMLLVYPDLNARWLLTGMGSMLSGNSEAEQKPANTLPFEATSAKPPVINSGKDDGPLPQEKKEHNTNYDSKPVRFTSDAVDKVFVLYKDGTFDTYRSRSKD